MQLNKFLALCLLLLFAGQRFAGFTLDLLQFPVLCLLGMGLSMESMCAGCDCGVTYPGPCEACSGNLTGRYQVVISGMADLNCTSCSSLDGTYLTDLSTSGCFREDSLPTADSPQVHVYGDQAVCPNLVATGCTGGVSPGFITVDIFVSFDSVLDVPFVQLRHKGTRAFGGGVNSPLENIYQWTVPGGSVVDCTSISSLSLTFFQQGAESVSCGLGPFPNAGASACTAAGATCELTAVP